MKSKTIILGITLLFACGAAIADPISLVTFVAANVLPVHWDQRTGMNMAKAQVRQARIDYPGEPIGGRLICAQLTRTTCWIETVGDIEEGGEQ